MKLFLKQAPLIILVLAIIHLMMRYALDYWFGYYEMPDSFFASRLIVCLVGFVMFVALLIMGIVSMIQARDRLWVTSMLIGLLTVAGLELMKPDPGILIIFGLRDRMMRDYKLDTLRQFARDIDQLPTPADLPSSLGKVFMHDDLNLVKTHLKEEYAFLNGGNAPSSITEINGVVNVWWGRQQWGFSVVVNDRTDAPALVGSNAIIILPVSKDVAFSAANDD